MFRVLLLVCLICLLGAPPLSAQQPAPAAQTPAPPTPPPSSLNDLAATFAGKTERVSENHWRWTIRADLEPQKGVRFFADQIDWYTDTNRLVATGNVVFTNAEGRIAAESVEFDVANGTGTFHDASGIMALGKTVDRAQFGNQDPEVMFYGQTIEKLGVRRYRVTRGGFTTCVQPTPRWELVSGKVVLNLNEYAIARNTVLRVKGVPLFYLPVIYYPIQDNERATGFLLPTYGTSTFRGQAVSNAFFWAINRSQDATFFHDWFTRAGQGEGGEYRYIAGPQSSGNFRVYRFARNETQYTNSPTSITVLPANTSFEVDGTASQAIGSRLRARARLDYFSDLYSQQLLHQNLYQASRRNRLLEGSVAGNFGPLATSALVQRNEVLNSLTDSVVYGGTPRATASIAAQRLFNSPVYVSMNTEYAFLPYEQRTNGLVTQDLGFGRIDAAPTIRVPLSRLTFLSVNTSAGYRTTYYTRSRNASKNMVDESFLRRYASVRTDVVGPVFTRIWDLPESGFAERLKHVIEPAFTVDTTSPIGDYTRTPFHTDVSDFVVGGASRITYGITNRLFYRGKTENGVRGQTREFVTVGVQQTYYSNPDASTSDTAYQSSSGRTVDLSPIALNARISPRNAFDANARLEYNVSGNGLQAFSAGGSFNGASGSASMNYSRTQFSRTSDANSYITTSARAQLLDRRTTATYSLSWDIGHSYLVSQSLVASYMAQCCGLQVEFQKYNFLESSGIPLQSDVRFNFGFTLAGLGTFSNFFGAFGGQPR